LILAVIVSIVGGGCGNSEPTSEPNVNKEIPAGEPVERSPGRVKDAGDN